MFYTAWCYKVTTLAILWQWLLHVWKWSPRPIKFSCKKSQETTEDASMPLEKHNGKALLCSGALVAQMWAQTPRKPLSLLHGTWPTMNEPSWWQETDNDMIYTKWATWQLRTNDDSIIDQCCFPIIDQQCFWGRILMKREKCAPARWLCCLECCPAHQKVAVWAWVRMHMGSNQSMFLSLPSSL